jgi:hypothetical protein
VARLAQKHGKAKALTILAHKLARAMYGMLSRGHAFDATKFFPAPAAAGRAIPTTDRPPETTASAPGRRRRAIRPDDAARSGPTRRVLEGGRYLTTPTIDASTGEIGPSDGDGVSMLSTIHAH